MRSAKAPTISAGVMIANVIWKVMKTVSGIVPDRLSTVRPARNSLHSGSATSSTWRACCACRRVFSLTGWS